mgnify:CR=1 FL=1
MNFLLRFLFFFNVFFSMLSINSQEKNKCNFRSPLGIPILLSGNFGELRSNHFHTGLDIKTNGKINYRIYSIDTGFVEFDIYKIILDSFSVNLIFLFLKKSSR